MDYSRPSQHAKHEEVDETAQELLEYGAKPAAYNLEDTPQQRRNTRSSTTNTQKLNADSAEIILEYRQEGIEFTVDAPSAPGRPG